MRINAYVLAADPDYLAASVASYYDLVDRIVVSYDAEHRSFSGLLPVPVEACRAELATVDPAGKLDFRPGDYSDGSRPPMECETRQRRAALAQAGDDADWVLQLDSDEVLPDPGCFAGMIERADAAACDGLLYPSRWLYGKGRGGRWLETCSRFWGPAAGYPGQLAVRPSAELTVARQTAARTFRVDFRDRNTDPWRSADDVIDATVPLEAGVLHFSWAREEAVMRQKSQISGHRDDFDWDAAIARWQRCLRRPRLAALGTPLRRKDMFSHGWLRTTSIPFEPPVRVEA